MLCVIFKTFTKTRRKVQSRLAEQETQQVKAVLDRFTAAWNAKDLEAFGALFAAEAEFTDVVGQVAIGREAIIKQHVFPFEKVMKFARFSMDEVYIRKVVERLIVVSAQWTVSGSVSPDQKPLPDRHGIVQFIMEQQSAAPMILLVHNSDRSLPYERQEKFIH